MHNNLNHSKGTIYAPCLNDVPETEIVENLSDQGVVSAYKFLKRYDGQTVASGVVLLTFDLYQLPEKLEVSWYTTKVRPYFPNPMRCKSCQILGHTTKRCNKTPACDSCALPPHTPTPCSRTFCANCSGDHAASSKSCPKFVQMKQIITIKTEKKCSMREAIRIQKMQIPPTLNESSPSFSNVTKNTYSNPQNNINTTNTTNHQAEQTSRNPNNLNIIKTNNTTKGSNKNTINTSFKPVSPTPTVDTLLPSTSNNNNSNPQTKQIFSTTNNANSANINANEYNANIDSTVDCVHNNSVDYYNTNPTIFSFLSQLSQLPTHPLPPVITESPPQKEE
ncbi:rhoGEF domain-containing protein gxcJ-like [Anastrepha obliqua]|uniref:rhoGEF domain-containing protein gxcJ-like n=1 Tax=Anastrepha obliqua TaxID=95512 RepID=UPI002409E381|nr:rhoGEF domain-containing protein gxcJ-like [Anastrepha obliqua]